MNTCVIIAAPFAWMTLPAPGDYGMVSMWVSACRLHVCWSCFPPDWALWLFGAVSVWACVNVFSQQFPTREGEHGLDLRVLSLQLLHSKGRGSWERASLEWNFKSLCSTEKGRSSAQNFLFFILESFGVCSVQHQGCNELDWGPLWPQWWIRCLQHQQSVLGDAELHSTGSGYTFKMN